MSDLKWKTDIELVDVIQSNQAYIKKIEGEKENLQMKIRDIDASINAVSQRSEWAIKYLSREEQPAYLKTRHDPMRSE